MAINPLQQKSFSKNAKNAELKNSCNAITLCANELLVLYRIGHWGILQKKEENTADVSWTPPPKEKE